MIDWLLSHPNEVGAYAGAAGAVFAAVGLAISGWQTRQSSRSTDFESLVRLDEMVRALEEEYGRAIASSSKAEAKQLQVRIFNKLEVLSGGYRNKLLGPQSRKYAKHFLVDVLALQEHYQDTSPLAPTRQGAAWEDLTWFTGRHRALLDLRKAQYAQMDASDEGRLGN